MADDRERDITNTGGLLGQRGRLIVEKAPRLARLLPKGTRQKDEAHQAIRDVLSERPAKPGYVYLIHIPPHYKIGKSKHPKKRFKGQQYPPSARLVHTIRTSDIDWAEDYLHDRYAAVRLSGEWFALSEDEVADICAIQELEPSQ